VGEPRIEEKGVRRHTYDHTEGEPLWGLDLVYSFYTDDKTSYPLVFRQYKKAVDENQNNENKGLYVSIDGHRTWRRGRTHQRSAKEIPGAGGPNRQWRCSHPVTTGSHRVFVVPLAARVELVFVTIVLGKELVECSLTLGRKNLSCDTCQGLVAGLGKTCHVRFGVISLAIRQRIDLIQWVGTRKEIRNRQLQPSPSSTVRFNLNVQSWVRWRRYGEETDLRYQTNLSLRFYSNKGTFSVTSNETTEPTIQNWHLSDLHLSK